MKEGGGEGGREGEGKGGSKSYPSSVVKFKAILAPSLWTFTT